MQPKVQYAGAIYDKEGNLLFVDKGINEETAWELYLGWPDEEGIERAKAEGDRFMKVFVTPRE